MPCQNPVYNQGFQQGFEQWGQGSTGVLMSVGLCMLGEDACIHLDKGVY